MRLTLRPVELIGPDREGRLVFLEERLVAVLSKLGELHEDATGHWFLEASFTPTSRSGAGPFATLEDALAAIGTGLNASPGIR